MLAFTHLNTVGESRMVDVSNKEITKRLAIATGRIYMETETIEKIYNLAISKGNVLEIARLAGILAAKQTQHLIPLCHPLMLNAIQVNFTRQSTAIEIEASVKVNGVTGVEMEALTAVSITALTIYDMCKAVDKSMIIGDISLIYKEGGKSGIFRRSDKICQAK